MRDGVRLLARSYAPVPGTASLPAAAARRCLLIRTDRWEDPTSGNDPARSLPGRLSSRGWTVIVQMVRGQGGSEGVFAPYSQEINDGIDTLSWLGGDGHWGRFSFVLYGMSYSGQCALYAAVHAPEHPEIAGLVCGNVSGNMNQWGLCTGGILNGATVRQAIDWASPPDGRLRVQDFPPCSFWHPSLSPLSARPEIEEWFLDLQRNCGRTPFWEQDCYNVRIISLMHPRMRTLFLSQWSDPFCPGTLGVYEQFCSHCINRPQVDIRQELDGCRDDAVIDWLDGAFGAGAAGPNLPSAGGNAGQSHYFICGYDGDHGDGAAGDAADFGNLEPTPYYLGEEALSGTPPPARNDTAALYTVFQHDPRHEPDCGDRGVNFAPATPWDGRRRPLGNSMDCAVFVAPPFAEAMQLIGVPRLRMWVKSSHADATFVVRLVVRRSPRGGTASDDVAFCYGARRLSTQMAGGGPGAKSRVQELPVALEIALRPVAAQLPAGAQLRLEVSSADYPRFITPPNAPPLRHAPSPFLPSVNAIYHSRHYPSRLWLPLRKAAANG